MTDKVPGRVALGITTMLSIVAMSNNVFDDAPRTSYLKAIDAWDAALSFIWQQKPLPRFVLMALINDFMIFWSLLNCDPGSWSASPLPSSSSPRPCSSSTWRGANQIRLRIWKGQIPEARWTLPFRSPLRSCYASSCPSPSYSFSSSTPSPWARSTMTRGTSRTRNFWRRSLLSLLSLRTNGNLRINGVLFKVRRKVKLSNYILCLKRSQKTGRVAWSRVFPPAVGKTRQNELLKINL